MEMLLEVLKRIVALVALAFWLNLLAAVKFPSFFGVTKNFICLCNLHKFALGLFFSPLLQTLYPDAIASKACSMPS